jgi:hypothetical protein
MSIIHLECKVAVNQLYSRNDNREIDTSLSETQHVSRPVRRRLNEIQEDNFPQKGMQHYQIAMIIVL